MISFNERNLSFFSIVIFLAMLNVMFENVYVGNRFTTLRGKPQ